jgi:hypothetical protein
MSCTDLAESGGATRDLPDLLGLGKERNQKKWDHLEPEWTATYRHETIMAAHRTCVLCACNNRSHHESVRSDVLIQRHDLA